MKAHQRIIREQAASSEEDQGKLFIGEDTLIQKTLAYSLDNASVRRIDYVTAQTIILKYEWLGNMGTTEFSFGLYFGDYLAGVVCFGRTAGTNVYASVAGASNAGRVMTLNRGACVHWAHPHSASFLITWACREMAKLGYNIILAYSDTDAGEIGTVYQASNWLYCGMTHGSELFRTLDGKVKDSRLVSAYTRDRRNHFPGDPMKYSCSRKEMKQRLVDEGCVFFKGNPKHRYVGLYGDKRTVRNLRKEISWTVLPYPKRAV